jgi:ATP-dependent helicase/nuclease subunit B
LCGEACGPRRRARAGRLCGGFARAALAEGTLLPRRDLAAALRQAMDGIAVRPPWAAIRAWRSTALEARGTQRSRHLRRADRRLARRPRARSAAAACRAAPSGRAGAEFRIGLAAHDLAGCLGAPQVVLSWARRDEGSPVIPSRFVLRVQAMLGETLAARHRERGAGAGARH